MYLQHTFSLATGGIGTEALFWIALVLCACLVGAEAFGIYTLIKKLLPVFRGARREEEEDSAHPLGGAVLMFGAVPMPLQVTLLIFMIAAAVGAVVLVALLVLLRVKGYEMAFDELPALEEDEPTAEEDEEVEEEAIPAFAESDPDVVPVSAPDEEALPVSAMIPVYSSKPHEGQAPYIEKHFKETYREVIRETEKYSPATEEILRAIEELMKVSIQLRTEREMAVGAAAASRAPDMPDPDEEIEEREEESGEDDEGESETSGDLFSAGERIVGFDEDTGCYIVAHYRKSLEAKLIQARPEVKKYYSEIKNALLSYEGTTDRITWTLDTFTNERTPIARVNVRPAALDLYLSLDPATLEDSVYRGRDVGDKKKYADTPFLFRVNSARKLTLALELVQRTAEEHGLPPIDIETVNYEELYPFEATDALVERGLIREYLREEKPSVTFELAGEGEEHPEADKPQEEPRSTFSTWELDTGEEEAAEETPGEAPVTEASSTLHETVTTTERTYHEYSYGDDPEQTVRTATERTTVARNPIEVITAAEEESEDAHLTLDGSGEEAVEEATEETVEEAAEETVEEAALLDGTAEEEDIPIPEFTEAKEPPAEESEEELWKSFEGVIKDIFYEEPEKEEEESDEGEEEIFGTFEVVDDKEILTAPKKPRRKRAPKRESEEAPAAEEEDRAIPAASVSYGSFDPDEEEEETPTDGDGDVPWVEDEIEAIKIEEPEEAEEETEAEVEVESEEAEAEAEEEAEEEPEEEAEEDAEEAPVTAPRAINAEDPTVALIDVCTFDKHFESGAVINLEVLKSVGLVDRKVTKLKLFASGELKGKFTVEANHFTLDAIMAISAADGDSVMIR